MLSWADLFKYVHFSPYSLLCPSYLQVPLSHQQGRQRLSYYLIPGGQGRGLHILECQMFHPPL